MSASTEPKGLESPPSSRAVRLARRIPCLPLAAGLLLASACGTSDPGGTGVGAPTGGAAGSPVPQTQVLSPSTSIAPSQIDPQPDPVEVPDIDEQLLSARLEEIRDIWYAAADRQIDEPWARAQLAAAAGDPNPQIAAVAENALSDLRKLSAREEGSATGSSNDSEGGAPLARDVPGDPGGEPHPEGPKMEQPPDVETLAQEALREPDSERRMLAVTELALYRSSTVGEILAFAAADPDPAVRYGALQSLWHCAADGIGDRDEVLDLLEASLGDDDPSIAELAGRALGDLQGTSEAEAPDGSGPTRP